MFVVSHWHISIRIPYTARFQNLQKQGAQTHLGVHVKSNIMPSGCNCCHAHAFCADVGIKACLEPHSSIISPLLTMRRVWEEERLRAIGMLQAGRTQGFTVRQLHVSQSVISRLWARYVATGRVQDAP